MRYNYTNTYTQILTKTHATAHYIQCTYVHRCTHTNVSISEQGKAGLSHESDRAADTLHVKLQTES